MSAAKSFRFTYRQFAWAVVFSTNLIVPLFFGLELTRGGGRWGMGLAIALFWLSGHFGCVRFKTISSLVVVGGFLVSLSQFFPILQIIAGCVSLQCASFAGMAGGQNAETPDQLTELGGFFVTILTGGQLLYVALLCGIVIRELAHFPRRDVDWSVELGRTRRGVSGRFW